MVIKKVSRRDAEDTSRRLLTPNRVCPKEQTRSQTRCTSIRISDCWPRAVSWTAVVFSQLDKTPLTNWRACYKCRMAPVSRSHHRNYLRKVFPSPARICDRVDALSSFKVGVKQAHDPPLTSKRISEMYSGHQRVHEDEGFNPFQSQSAHLPNSRPSGMMETNRVPSRLPDAHPLHPVGPSLPPVQGSQPIYGGVGPYDIDPLDPTPYPGYPTEPQGPAPDQNQPQGPPPSQQQHFQNAPQHDAPTYAPSSSPMQNPPAQPMFNTHHPEQRPVRLSQRQPQQQPAHAPFVTTNNHAPSRTAPYQTMHGVPRAAWFTNDNLPRTQQPATYIPGSSRQNHAPYQFHARDASVSSSSSTTDIANIDSPMGPSPTYGSPAEIDQSHSYALQQYAPPSLPPPRAPVSSAIVGTVPPDVEEQSPTDDGNAVALNTVQPGANTMFVDGIPVPPHQQYYPRSAWGPPPPRKVVQARMEEQRRLQQAQASGVRSGGSSDVSLSNTVNPAALGGSGSKRKQPPESDAVADIANVEMTNPTSGDLDNLVDGYSDNEKPPYPLSTILKFTLLGSPRGKLTLAEIYDTLMARFPFFKHVKTDWQVCCLFTNRCRDLIKSHSHV